MKAFSLTSSALLVTLALLGGASARSLSQAAMTPGGATGTCPIKADAVSIDFSPIATSCVPGGANYCGACVCSLVQVYLPAFQAAGLTVDSTGATPFPIEQATGIIEACTAEYFAPMTAAGVNITMLEGLTTCDFTAANVPDCLVTEIAKLAADNTTAAAAPVNAEGGRTDTSAPISATSNPAPTPTAAPTPAAAVPKATPATKAASPAPVVKASNSASSTTLQLSAALLTGAAFLALN